MSASQSVNIRILEQEYTIGTAIDERDGLIAAARILDGKMREIRDKNRMMSVEQAAILAALNIAHELQQLQDKQDQQGQELAISFETLKRQLDNALTSLAHD